jgi:hypothetical protein
VGGRRQWSAVGVNGGRAFTNDIQLDGLPVMGGGYNEATVVPNTEGLQEVRVISNNFSAEYGRGQAVIAMSTKSGTNKFSGQLGYLGRNEKLDANTFSNNAQGIAKRPFRVHDFGGTYGGPILRNKVFFFGAVNPSWETREFKAPAGFPLESLGFVERKRSNLNYSAKATWQIASSHRVDASFFGDPSEGELGPQRLSALTAQTTSRYSSLEKFGGNNQTGRYDGVLSPTELPGGRGKPVTRGQHRARLAAAFARQDHNHDGFLDARELATPPQ